MRDLEARTRQKLEQSAENSNLFCNLCRRGFTTDAEILQHVETVHQNNRLVCPAGPGPGSREVFRCALCYKQYQTLQRLHSHLLYRHGRGII